MKIDVLIGFGIAAFGFSPVWAIGLGVENSLVYLSSLATIIMGAIRSFFSYSKQRAAAGVEFGAPVNCIWAFFILIILHAPGFDISEQYEALISVGLCIICIYSTKFANPDLVMKGIIHGTTASALIGAVYMASNIDYDVTRSGGFVAGSELHYLTIALPVAATIGANIIFIRSTEGLTRLIWCAILGALVLGLSYTIARTAVISALIASGLAITFSFRKAGWKRFIIIITSALAFIPLQWLILQVFLDSNEGLYRRFERFLDPASELEIGGRGWAWSKAFQLFTERPLWGWNVHGVEAEIGYHAHNAILEAAGDLGIGGGIAIAAIFILFFRSVFATLVNSRSADSVAGHLIGFVIAIEALKSNTVYLSRITLLILVLVPTLSVKIKQKNSNLKTSSNPSLL